MTMQYRSVKLVTFSSSLRGALQLADRWVDDTTGQVEIQSVSFTKSDSTTFSNSYEDWIAVIIYTVQENL